MRARRGQWFSVDLGFGGGRAGPHDVAKNNVGVGTVWP